MRAVYNAKYVTVCNLCKRPIGVVKPEHVYNIWRIDNETGEMVKAKDFDVCARCYPIIEAVGLLYKQAEEIDKERDTEKNVKGKSEE